MARVQHCHTDSCRVRFSCGGHINHDQLGHGETPPPQEGKIKLFFFWFLVFFVQYLIVPILVSKLAFVKLVKKAQEEHTNWGWYLLPVLSAFFWYKVIVSFLLPAQCMIHLSCAIVVASPAKPLNVYIFNCETERYHAWPEKLEILHDP